MVCKILICGQPKVAISLHKQKRWMHQINLAHPLHNTIICRMNYLRSPFYSEFNHLKVAEVTPVNGKANEGSHALPSVTPCSTWIDV